MYLVNCHRNSRLSERTGTTRSTKAAAGFVVGAGGVFVRPSNNGSEGQGTQAGTGSLSETAKAKRGGRKGNFKGERGRAGSPSGTPNPFKHLKRDKNDPTKVIRTDANGKKISRKGTKEELDYFNSRNGPPKTSIIQDVARETKGSSFILLGVCILAPSTCSLIDRNGNNNIDGDELLGLD